MVFGRFNDRLDDTTSVEGAFCLATEGCWWVNCVDAALAVLFDTILFDELSLADGFDVGVSTDFDVSALRVVSHLILL